ncbi:MAG: hypothetical protein KIS68_15465 [Bauldia sp.]|nr:hypothetical protein [Bauldia sp.]
MQSWRMSLIEAVTNTTVGYALAVGTQLVVFPFYGLDAALPEHLAIGAVFVLVSLVRSYVLRRAFAGAWRRVTGGKSPRPAHDGLRGPAGSLTRTSEVD